MAVDLKAIARLHYITHPVASCTLAEQVDLVTTAGGRWIQFRLKNTLDKTFKDRAEEALSIARQKAATFIVNDQVLVAKAIHADGVHIGKEDLDPSVARKILGDDKIIGCTANTLEDILYLNTQPVDYIGLGPFRYTGTKQKLSPILGLGAYQEIMKQLEWHGVDIPIIAIGGITIADIGALLTIGIHGIATSGAIINSTSPTASCEAMLNELKRNSYDPTLKNSR